MVASIEACEGDNPGNFGSRMTDRQYERLSASATNFITVRNLIRERPPITPLYTLSDVALLVCAYQHLGLPFRRGAAQDLSLWPSQLCMNQSLLYHCSVQTSVVELKCVDSTTRPRLPGCATE